MTTRKENGRWYYRKWVRLPDGTKRRIFGTPRSFNLPNNRAGAEEAERRAIAAVLAGEPSPSRAQAEPTSSVPTLSEFEPTFLEHSRAKNKPRTVNSKAQILRDHILPALGSKRLDLITYAVIEDFKHELVRAIDDAPPGKGLSGKTANNVLTILRRLIMLAKKRGHVSAVPEIEWLRNDRPDFDFLDFEEADRLVAGADDAGDWRAMIHVALRTGLRQGELLALRWDDVDLERRRIVVARSVSRGAITAPKGNRPRTVELGEIVTAVLRGHRHLRGQLVFCDADGEMLSAGACKHPLYRAARRAKLRRVGWHVLRHTYASHLAMRGASPKAIQELLGHATLEMTMRYMHLSPATKQAAAQLLDHPAQNLPDITKRGGA